MPGAENLMEALAQVRDEKLYLKHLDNKGCCIFVNAGLGIVSILDEDWGSIVSKKIDTIEKRAESSRHTHPASGDSASSGAPRQVMEGHFEGEYLDLSHAQ
ncbi:unnamed protein product [Clonostachys chloroleuca]|uniref:Uncharacterized protein n=1 Tax=Clonostachys chloroleuca TaxID=1926264 RepID=A0AA35M441_9HYPO|nr:unnamed protein product [Clonostachys chloroleuca]